MKKSFLLLTAVSGMLYVSLSSYSSGAAGSGQNRTGVNGSLTTCGGAGCHGTGTTTVVNIAVDSTGGVPVSGYVPGMTYTVRISGTNDASLSRYGFQFATVSGTSGSHAQAGTYSGLPSGVAERLITGSSVKYVEHTGTRTESTAGAFSIAFQWTAPATAVGNITMFGTVNAVNGAFGADPGDISGNRSKTLVPYTVTTGVAATIPTLSLTAYPNPATSQLNLNLSQAAAGNYTLQVLDITGKTYATETATGGTDAAISTAALATGRYILMVTGANTRQAIPFVKQ